MGSSSLTVGRYFTLSDLVPLTLRQEKDLELGPCTEEGCVGICDHDVSEERSSLPGRELHRLTTDLFPIGVAMVSPSFDSEQHGAFYGNGCPQAFEFSMYVVIIWKDCFAFSLSFCTFATIFQYSVSE